MDSSTEMTFYGNLMPKNHFEAHFDLPKCLSAVLEQLISTKKWVKMENFACFNAEI